MFQSKTNAALATIAAIAAILGFGYFMQPGTKSADNIMSTSANAATKKVDLKTLMEPNLLPDNVMGAKDAKVTIVEYSSMTCSHCATFHAEILPTIKKDYIDTGKVKYIIREFPLDNLAFAAFQLGRCAPKDKYFAFIDMMYKQQAVWAFAKTDRMPIMLRLAKGAGFTEKSFNECIKNDEIYKGISAMRAKGSKLGVNSTPSFFINGELASQINDVKAFAKLLDAKLK